MLQLQRWSKDTIFRGRDQGQEKIPGKGPDWCLMQFPRCNELLMAI